MIKKQRNRKKVFKPFEDISKPFPSINAIEISYGFVYKRSSKLVIKGYRVETIEDARNNISSYWKRVGGKQKYLNPIFKI